MSAGPSVRAPIGVCALTGARGYVGSHLRRSLERAGWSVVELTRRPPAGPSEVGWSLEDPRSLADELRARRVSALVHAAWDFGPLAWRDVERINVEGSARLFDEAVGAGIGRVVFVSSMSAHAGARSNYGRAKLAVERLAADHRAVVIRPGLVYGRDPGGVLGAMASQVDRWPVVPAMGTRRHPQYLVHEADVGAAVAAALCVEPVPARPVTVAHRRAWTVPELLASLAEARGRRVRVVRVPWRLVHAALRTGEALGVRRPGLRSDSVQSLVHPNPAPDFNCADVLGIEPRPFPGESA